MRTQIRIIALAFIAFGIIAWIGTKTFSPAYLGLMGFGLAGLALSLMRG